MDPTDNLAKQLKLAKKILKSEADGDWDEGEMQIDAPRLAKLIIDFDQLARCGSLPPIPWRKNIFSAETELWRVRTETAEARAEKAEAELAKLTAPPPLVGPALRDKLINDALASTGLVFCRACKGTGQFFDCEDEEYVGCHHCDGKGTAKS